MDEVTTIVGGWCDDCIIVIPTMVVHKLGEMVWSLGAGLESQLNLFCILYAAIIWGSYPPSPLTKGEVPEQFPPWQSPLVSADTTFQGRALRAGFGGGLWRRWAAHLSR